ncbi:uncharacterized protein [Euphorbia lathyris]|uniref:uncharacterized protein isoform X2 n=1 Tax=Euphorbia lathyris TaxID=212925 RepID=UPI0033131AC5
MKRKRISSDTTRGRKQTEEVSQVETPYSGSLFSDLPKDIQLNILIRVSIKGIFVLKCVCKTWYDIVSDPEFAKLHFDLAEVYPLIRTSFSRGGSKMVHLMQPNKDDFELNLGMCDHTLSKPGCVSTVHDKIEARFEVPKIYGLMKTHNGHGIVTCNGLLFSPNMSDRHRPIVCNPVTDALVYMDPKENQLRYLKVCQCKIDSEVAGIAHIPSFVSLKHALSGQNVKVYNVQSSCAKVVQRPRYHRSCKLPQRHVIYEGEVTNIK